MIGQEGGEGTEDQTEEKGVRYDAYRCTKVRRGNKNGGGNRGSMTEAEKAKQG